MWIKVILLAAISVVALIGMRAPRGARHVALRRIAMIGFGVFAATSVLFPGLWNTLAQAVGVGRGTDLLLYLLIVVFLGFVATSYMRFRGLESQITQLSRRIALDEVGVRPIAAASWTEGTGAPEDEARPV